MLNQKNQQFLCPRNGRGEPTISILFSFSIILVGNLALSNGIEHAPLKAHVNGDTTGW